jgi:hypothetical protein
MRLRLGFWAFVACVLPSSGQALELAGRFGYAGEWDLAATVAPAPDLAPQAFAGPLRMKHLAICGPGEVSEKSGSIEMRRSGFGRRYAVSFRLGEEVCSASGQFSDTSVAFADCGAQGRVPLRLWLK